MSGSLEIALVCYPSLGGSGVIASELAAGLARRGHRVHVLASAPPRRALPAERNLIFHRVAVPDYPLYEQPPYGLAVAEALVGLSRRVSLDLVHVHYAVPHAASALLARQVLGTPRLRYVTSLHGTDVTGSEAPSAIREVLRFAVASSDRVTVPSRFLRDEARRLLALPPDCPIDVIANFVDTERFTPALPRDRRRLDALFGERAGDGPVLLHVSNLRPVKRVADLVDVLCRVRRVVPARLLVVGDGPEREFLSRCAAECGVADYVRLLGGLTDFAEILAHGDVFVLPSASESFGVAALEALSAAIPVCGYRVGGLPELIDERVGCLVAPFDTEALAAAVLDVVGDEERRRRLGEAARARAVSTFGLAAALARYEEMYRAVLAAGRES